MEKEPMQEGSWVIDLFYKELGTVLRMFPESVSAKFGKRTSLRTKQQVKMAPLDIQQEDLKDMMELALMTKDFDWAREISKQMKEGVKG